MKRLYETFTDEEFKFLKKIKNGLSWHDFIVLIATHCKEAIKRGDLKINNK